VHALHNIHAALVLDGVIVDTQPISPYTPVRVASRELGGLDMRAWVDEIRAVDERFDEAIAAGLYGIEYEEHFTVADTFDTGPECLETVRAWSGTRVPPALAARLESAQAPVTVEGEVRLRVLRRAAANCS
jgi:hypothetical protein